MNCRIGAADGRASHAAPRHAALTLHNGHQRARSWDSVKRPGV
jgi:hypothetical protein